MTQTEIRPLIELSPWPIEDSIRVVGGVRYLTPPTPHWADWRDDEATVYHGVRIGNADVDQIRQEVLSAAVLDAWDHQDGGRITKVKFNPAAQFELLRTYSVDLEAPRGPS